MASKQNKTALHSSLIGIFALLMPIQIVANGSEVAGRQNGGSPQTSVVLEITLRCDGMCGTARAMRLRLFEDALAEYLSSKSNAFDFDKGDILLKKNAQLTKEEYDQFIRLAESPQFLKSAIHYDSGVNFADLLALTAIIYKNKGTLKQILLKNFVPSPERSTNDPPDEVKQLVQLSYDLCDKIRKNWT